MLFPYHDNNPTKKFPIITVSLIIINVIIFMVFGFNPDYERVISEYGFTPNHFSFLTLITSIFLHSDIFHLLFNMWFLWLFGDNLEDKLGKLIYICFYLAGGFAATFAHSLLSSEAMRNIPCIGASGAISAVMGCYIIFFPRARIRTYFLSMIYPRIIELSAFLFLGLWFVGQLINSSRQSVSVAGIAYFAHIGGFAFGAAIGYLLKLCFIPEKELALPADEQHKDTQKKLDSLIDTANKEIQENDEGLAYYKTNIENYLKEGNINSAVEKYTEFEKQDISGALSPESQMVIADALMEGQNKLLALQAYMRFIKNYEDDKSAPLIYCKIGLLCSRDFKSPAEGMSYLQKGLKNIAIMKDNILLQEAQQEMAALIKIFDKTFLAIKEIEEESVKFAVIAQSTEEELFDAEKIFKTLQTIGMTDGKNASLKLSYNAESNLKKKTGVILQNLEAKEAILAVERLRSVNTPVVMIQQQELLQYPIITTIVEAGIDKEKLLLKDESQKQFSINFSDIIYTTVGQIPYFVCKKVSSENDVLDVKIKGQGSEDGDLKIDDFNVNRILDIFTQTARLRISNSNFNYIKSNGEAAGKDKFEIFVEDLSAVLGGEKIDSRVRIFISNHKWQDLNFKDINNFNEKGLWVVRLKYIYSSLLERRA